MGEVDGPRPLGQSDGPRRMRVATLHALKTDDRSREAGEDEGEVGNKGVADLWRRVWCAVQVKNLYGVMRNRRFVSP